MKRAAISRLADSLVTSSRSYIFLAVIVIPTMNYKIFNQNMPLPGSKRGPLGLQSNALLTVLTRLLMPCFANVIFENNEFFTNNAYN